MITPNDDGAGDWIRQFISEDEFNEMVDKSRKYIYNQNEGIILPVHLSYNDCIALCKDWYSATTGDKMAQFRLHSIVGTFVLWVEEMLGEEGISWRDEL